MTAPISTPPWDLAAGNRWTLEQDGLIDHGNESITAKDGQIVAYVAGGMENGNGALLAKAPDLMAALAKLTKLWADFTSQEMYGEHLRAGLEEQDFDAWDEAHSAARDVLRKAGAL
jgi:hypothetical protein